MSEVQKQLDESRKKGAADSRSTDDLVELYLRDPESDEALRQLAIIHA